MKKKKKERKKGKNKNPKKIQSATLTYTSFFSIRLFHVTITGAIDRGMIFCATSSSCIEDSRSAIGRGRLVAKNYYFFETGDSGREIVDRANRKNRRWKNVKFCSWIELKEREKQREKEVEMETKLMKKKKGKKWKKFFPSCAHVRFERGRIQHSRVPFSSGVALRCHTFPTLDVETYTFAPVHIVVCLQRSRERKQPRG